MKCLICGKEINNGVVCNECREKVTEEMCYRVAQCDYHNPDIEVWQEVIDEMDKPYLFTDFSLELAEYVKGDRIIYTKIACMSKMTKELGIYKKYFGYVKENVDEDSFNDCLSEEENNFVKAMLLYVYMREKNWDKVDRLYKKINLDEKFFEPYRVLAEYYKYIRKYDEAIEIIESAKKIFLGDMDIINNDLKDIIERKNGEKKDWGPSVREEKKEFYYYLEKLGIEHEPLSNDKNNHVNKNDFKPFHRYNGQEIPKGYVAFWITGEYYVKAYEAVELSAIKVHDGRIVDRFHSFVRPNRFPKEYKYVKKEDVMKANPIDIVFKDFLEYVGDDVLASAGFAEQSSLLSILARYTSMKELEHEIFDVVEYGEDISEDFSTYTRSSLLEKYEVSEGESGMEKAEATVKLVEKMR